MVSSMLKTFHDFFAASGLSQFEWQQGVMIFIGLVLVYLAIKKGYEPMLLIPIGFGAIITNLPGTTLMMHPHGGEPGGFFYYIYQGIHLEMFPPIIFMGVGALTDFGPLIADPKTFLLGAAAQFGIFITFFGSLMLGFSGHEAASIGIIGGADGPTAIFTTMKLAPHLIGPIAVAAYSYMALVPMIQPPIMRLLTTKKQRQIIMHNLRPVSKVEKIVFPLLVMIVCILVVPASAPLLAMLMFGNLIREAGVVERLSNAAQNEIINITTIFLGLSVGTTMTADSFLRIDTLKILVMGAVAFSISTGAGVLFGQIMWYVSGKKINPLIGAAGVSAVPMAARVVHKTAAEENPKNFLLMHAMGPNVAGVIGSAVAAGVLLSIFGG